MIHEIKERREQRSLAPLMHRTFPIISTPLVHICIHSVKGESNATYLLLTTAYKIKVITKVGYSIHQASFRGDFIRLWFCSRELIPDTLLIIRTLHLITSERSNPFWMRWEGSSPRVGCWARIMFSKHCKNTLAISSSTI